MYANNTIDRFETLVRNRTFRFIEKLEKGETYIIDGLTNSWIIKFDVLNCLNRILFTN